MKREIGVSLETPGEKTNRLSEEIVITHDDAAVVWAAILSKNRNDEEKRREASKSSGSRLPDSNQNGIWAPWEAQFWDQHSRYKLTICL